MGDMLLGSSVTFGSLGLKLEAKDGKPSATKVWKNADLDVPILKSAKAEYGRL